MRVLYSVSAIIDYGRGIDEAIRAGCYDWVAEGINARHFSTNQSGRRNVTIGVIVFGEVLTTGEVLESLSRHGYRPAELLELLALSEEKPRLQLEAPLIALGSSWANWGLIFAPYLGGERGGRRLLLHSTMDDWADSTRFVAVRK
ncbi:hypothetical protein KKH05_01540 [Patescibacteria group bacterium]|nr:hypothetical protein [Patescibacteria group bacterium]